MEFKIGDYVRVRHIYSKKKPNKLAIITEIDPCGRYADCTIKYVGSGRTTTWFDASLQLCDDFESWVEDVRAEHDRKRRKSNNRRSK